MSRFITGWLFRQKFLVLPADRRSEHNFWRLRRPNPDPTPISRISENPNHQIFRKSPIFRCAEFADRPNQISLALSTEFQSDPKIPRFTRFCRSEIVTLFIKTKIMPILFVFLTNLKFKLKSYPSSKAAPSLTKKDFEEDDVHLTTKSAERYWKAHFDAIESS